MKILVIDDDADLLDLTTYALRREGFDVVAAIDGQQGLARWQSERPDLVLLDLNMPKVSGFEVCNRIRHESTTPIIMLTARDDEEDLVRALQLGADDYVTKPFSAKALTARMRAVLRRCQDDPFRQAVRTVQAGELSLDLQSHETTKAGRSVQLTPIEFRIMHLLAMNEGRVIPYARLIDYAWQYDGGDSNLLKTHVCHIRKKLDLPPGPGGIRTVQGVGYTLARP